MRRNRSRTTPGVVYLVGAGPGDPGLLTVKAARILETADVAVYDHLVADAILDRIPARAERIYAGKEASSHTMNQEAINSLLEERARRGQTVVRLKGGDPFMFGRGGEEAEYLSARGIRFEVVPGISSALAVPAYAGIPVTHRGVAASLAVVTGRAGPIGEAPAIEWERIAGADTVVILMGVANLDHLVERLIGGGRSPRTPAAAIRWGTTAQQRAIVGTLETIAAQGRDADLRPPAVLVVGGVVSLISRMRWAECRPLFGRRVLVPTAYPSPLTDPLEHRGAEVLHVAPVDVEPPASWAGLDCALAELRAFAVLLFTDPSGVDAFFARLAARRSDARSLAGRMVVADGECTADALVRHGIRADHVTDEWDGADAVGAVGFNGRWLIVGGSAYRAHAERALRRLGASYEAPAVCRQSTPKWRADRLRELLTTRPVHAIVFTHGAEVEQFVNALDPEERERLSRVTLVAAGDSVARILRSYALAPFIVRSGGSAPALVEALTIALVTTCCKRDG